MTDLEDQPYYIVKYTLWPTSDDADLGRHTITSHYHAEGKLDAINAAAYHVRGRKSDYELAWVDGVYGPFESLEEALDEEMKT